MLVLVLPEKGRVLNANPEDTGSVLLLVLLLLTAVVFKETGTET